MRTSSTSLWRFAGPLVLLLALLAACSQPVATQTTGAGSTVPAGNTPTVGATATNPPPSASPTARTGATPTTTQGTGAPVPGLAAALADVRVIDLTYSWSGLAPDSPVKSHRHLEWREGRFEGTAFFSASRDDRLRTATIIIALPDAAARAFFQALAGVLAQEGPYKAKVDHTDDYPSREIALVTAQGPVRFYSQSQVAGHWALDFAGHTYVINDDSPGTAWGAIASYLDDGTGQVLFDIARHAPFPGSRSTPTPKPVAALAVCGGGPATGTPPATPVAQPGAPVNLAAHYQLGPSNALVITGTGVVPVPQDLRIIRGGDRLTALLAALDQPTPFVGKANGASQDSILLTFRKDGALTSLYYDARLGLIGADYQSFYLVPAGFAEELRGHLCAS